MRILEAKFIEQFGFILINLAVNLDDRPVIKLKRPSGEPLVICPDDHSADFWVAQNSSVTLALASAVSGEFISVEIKGTKQSLEKRITSEDLSPQGKILATELRSHFGLESVIKSTNQSQLRALALCVLERCLRGLHAPDDWSTLRLLANALRKNAYGCAFSRIARHMIPSSFPLRDREFYGQCFDTYCDGLQYNNDVRTLCERELAVNGETYWYHTNMGHHNYMAGCREAADSHFLSAAAILRDLGVRNSGYNNSVFTWRDKQFCDVIATTPQSSSTEIKWGPESIGCEVAAVHLVGCDDGYFRKYGNSMIASSAQHARLDAVVHVHVSNPSQWTRATLAGWAGRTDVCVRYSFSHPTRVSKPYFTCLRYLVAPAVIERYSTPVFITDIDLVIARSWTETAKLTEGFDVGWHQNHFDISISSYRLFGVRPSDIPAGAIFVGNTAVGRAFLQFVRSYIEQTLSFSAPDRWYEDWGIDQTALGQALDFVVSPASAKALNIKALQFFRLPNMSSGGKDAFVKDNAPVSPMDFVLAD
ncbi:hypothetical protein EGK70_005510 [Alcaligenes aquatilis]|uniref:hypothetical protein n=1 Tax=Alcaligenes aquatilis TaxID=323284 RepID=UPI000F691BF4|nr:hypothetical protein [Alcaligenes aquatilis]QXR36973.1 hypothetical protein EGK70_005510 [Alcaligenes aquatilis]